MCPTLLQHDRHVLHGRKIFWHVRLRQPDVYQGRTCYLLCLQTPPAFALENPQGSDSAALEAQLEKLIEARTGKGAALPTLDEVPAVSMPCSSTR
jgi:hypothetical protein